MQALEEARLCPARFRPLRVTPAATSRDERASAEAELSQVDVEHHHSCRVAGGWNVLLCHPRRPGRLARPGGRLRFGRLPVLLFWGTLARGQCHTNWHMPGVGLGQAVADDPAITASDGPAHARSSPGEVAFGIRLRIF